MRTWIVVLGIALLPAVTAPARAASKQRLFTTPEEAVTDFVAAMKADDEKALRAMLGPEGEPLINSGDQVADRSAGERFVASYEAAHLLVPTDEGKRMWLETGTDRWPFPIPLVKEEGGWRWDTSAGKEEILARRIGRNELSAIEACRAYADAQREYYAENPQGDALLQFAQKIASTPGKRDGLYWETKEGEEPSPLGPLIATARGEGYAAPGSKPHPYHGYYYRVLTGQGTHAPGGSYSYMARGRMIGGFALVAFPSEWDNSGVMTFMVNQDGVVYQKDLGPKTESLAPAIKAFDPDDTWTRVPDEGAAAAPAAASAQ
jgi:hypothetical protein